MNYKNLQTKTDEPETFSAADEKIRALLGDLKRVEAPNDFDFRVRARIARHSRRDFHPRFLPVLRYVLPLAAVLIISAGFVFNSFYRGGSSSDSVVAIENTSPKPINENQSTQANSAENNPAISPPPASEKSIASSAPSAPIIPIKNNIAPAPDVARRVGVQKSAARARTEILPENSAPDNDGGTRSSALTQPKRIITPPGISLGKPVGDATNFVRTKSLTAREILLQIGIEASYQSEGWKVLSVQENSPAGRSGVKTGDAVEAIDGEKLTDKPLLTKTIEGKKLTVLRGSEKIEISLGIKAN